MQEVFHQIRGVSRGGIPRRNAWVCRNHHSSSARVSVGPALPTASILLDKRLHELMCAELSPDILPGSLPKAEDNVNVQLANDALVECPAYVREFAFMAFQVNLSRAASENEVARGHTPRIETKPAQCVEDSRLHAPGSGRCSLPGLVAVRGPVGWLVVEDAVRMPRERFARLLRRRAPRIQPEQVESRRVAECVSAGIEHRARFVQQMGWDGTEKFIDHWVTAFYRTLGLGCNDVYLFGSSGPASGSRVMRFPIDSGVRKSRAS